MAINYTKIGWDTTKYVNPTNMNQMDDGIKAACDGVDTLDTTVVKKAGDTMTGALTINVDTAYPLTIKRPTTAAPNLQFANSNGMLGALAVVPSTGRLNYAPNGGTLQQLAYVSEIPNAWRLTSGTAITATEEAHADLNTFATAGTYYLSSNTAGNVDNRPVTGNNRFTLIVQQIGNNAACIRQIYIRYNDNNFYVRSTSNTGSTWTNWTYMALGTHLDSYVKLSDSTAQIITTSAADYSYPLEIKPTHNTLSLIRYDDKNGTELGRIGVNTSKKPVFFDTSVHELLQLDKLKSVVAASTDFANFKTRIAAL